MNAPVHVVAIAVVSVGIVGERIVLKAVDDVVVVHVNAKEELGWIDVVAQKRLGEIRLAVVVLVKVRDEVRVLVVPRENLRVGLATCAKRRFAKGVVAVLPQTLPVGKAILVVVVVNRLKGIALRVFVVDKTPRIRDKRIGPVLRL